MVSPAPQRFHALDATRAFALLLGVVFHAAWSFVPRAAGAAVVDRSAHPLFDWFFFTSHSFRMQVFFLIAGFFAHLLYHRRGWRGFVRHRLARIAVPFLIGWLILCPLVVGVWMWGANLTGRNLIPLPIPVLLDLMYAKGLVLIPRSQGGLFNLVHLWFLYYLLWILLIVVAVRGVVARVAVLRRLADRVVAGIFQSPWSVLWLAAITGLFLWRMEGWNGVDTPIRQLAPSIPVLLLYGTFFVLGWLLHRQAGLLGGLTRHWKWQLGVAVAVSLLCFGAYKAETGRGGPTSATAANYPELWTNQISDWPAFIGALRSGEHAAAARPELAALWQRLPPPAQQAIARLPAAPSFDARAGVCEALNRLLLHPQLFSLETAGPAGLPTAEEARQRLERNRATLDGLMAGAITGDPTRQPGYQERKLAFSCGYGLLMWLLVLGCLGFFQANCTGESPAWRYVADSAYWIYLAHLPLVAALQIAMAEWRLPAFAKFPLLLAIAFAVLFASYHYFVRSTFLGQVLNGQRHPFTFWPVLRSPTPRVAASGVPAAAPTE